MLKKSIVISVLYLFSFSSYAQIDESFEKKMLESHKGQATIKEKGNEVSSYMDDQSRYFLSSYKQNYLLPFNYSSGYNSTYWNEEGDLKKHEAALQISIKYPLLKDATPFGGDLYVTYTNKSNWQLYSKSEPFRETFHMPELLIDFDKNWDFGSFKNTNILVGYTHQSNGLSGNASRGWDRLFTDFIFAGKDYSLSIRGWIPVSDENEEETNNHKIRDYYGLHEFNGRYYYQDLTFSAMTRFSVSNRKGAINLGVSKPLKSGISIYAEVFHGYGDSMIDFDNKISRVGVGFIFTNDLF